MIAYILLVRAVRSVPCCHREGKMESCAIAGFTLHPNASAVSLHGEAAERQSNAQAAGFTFAAQAREFIEDPFLLGRRNTRTVILDPDMQPVLF